METVYWEDISSLIGGNCVLGRHILPSLVETMYWEDISSLFGGNCVLGRLIFPVWWKLCIGKTYLPCLVETVYWEDTVFPHRWKLCIGKTYFSLIGGNCVLERHIFPLLVETMYWSKLRTREDIFSLIVGNPGGNCVEGRYISLLYYSAA